MTIIIEEAHGEYVASATDVDVFAFGETPAEARAQLLLEVDNQYWRFVALRRSGHLSKPLAATIPALAYFLIEETV